jgi:hypothetical protein
MAHDPIQPDSMKPAQPSPAVKEIEEETMVTKKEKAQASKRSGSGARGKPHTGGGSDQQGGGKKASSGDRTKGGGQPGGGKTGGQGA